MPHPPNSGLPGLDWTPPKPRHRTNRRTGPRSSWTTCKVPGCTETLGKSVSWGVYCPAHKIADRRWGHPLQTMLRVRELDPYLKVVKGVRERNKGANWVNVYARWQAVVGIAREYLDMVRKGIPHVNHRRQAAELITQIADSVTDARVVDLVMAVYLVQEFDPGRFRSDESFRAVLLHAIRREAGAGRRFDKKTSTAATKASYRIMSEKTRETAVAWLNEGLGLVGLYVAQRERSRVNALENTKAAYRDAVFTID